MYRPRRIQEELCVVADPQQSAFDRRSVPNRRPGWENRGSKRDYLAIRSGMVGEGACDRLPALDGRVLHSEERMPPAPTIAPGNN